MSRRYPLEPQESNESPSVRHQGREPLSVRSARLVAGWLVEVGSWRERHVDLSSALTGMLLLILGVVLAVAGLSSDTYMHRGVEQGNEEPFVVLPTDDRLATNADLRVFADDDLTVVADALIRGGFTYVRQPVIWSDIEAEPGSYDWETYDRIVEELSRRDIGMVAVVVDAPDWSRDEGTRSAADGSPGDPSDIGSFVQALADRYGNAVQFIQVWDQPNLPSRWGGTAATASEFLPFLAAAYNGARSGNSEVRILTPELATGEAEGEQRADLDFLEQLYRVGGAPFFDIVGIQLDGGTTSPDDRRIAEGRFNFSRAVLTRELMVEMDDAETPIWATSFGWARSDETSASEQAEFVVRALDRAWVEWPWMGLMFQWAFLPAAGSGAEPYALVNPDGNATELYRRLSDDAIQERAKIGETGFVPMDAESISFEGTWEDQHLEERTFKTTTEIGAEMVSEFRGNGATAVLRLGPETGNVIVEVDGEVVAGGAGESGEEWNLYWPSTIDTTVDLVSGLEYGDHTLSLRLAEEGTLTLGGIVIERNQPFVWPVVLLTVGSLLSFFLAIRSLIMLVGRRSGYLPHVDDEEAWPTLPSMPDWRPSRRA